LELSLLRNILKETLKEERNNMRQNAIPHIMIRHPYKICLWIKSNLIDMDIERR